MRADFLIEPVQLNMHVLEQESRAPLHPGEKTDLDHPWIWNNLTNLCCRSDGRSGPLKISSAPFVTFNHTDPVKISCLIPNGPMKIIMYSLERCCFWIFCAWLMLDIMQRCLATDGQDNDPLLHPAVKTVDTWHLHQACSLSAHYHQAAERPRQIGRWSWQQHRAVPPFIPCTLSQRRGFL